MFCDRHDYKSLLTNVRLLTGQNFCCRAQNYRKLAVEVKERKKGVKELLKRMSMQCLLGSQKMIALAGDRLMAFWLIQSLPPQEQSN